MDVRVQITETYMSEYVIKDAESVDAAIGFISLGYETENQEVKALRKTWLSGWQVREGKQIPNIPNKVSCLSCDGLGHVCVIIDQVDDVGDEKVFSQDSAVLVCQPCQGAGFVYDIV